MRDLPVNEEQLQSFWDVSQERILKLRVYELESLARTCRFFRPKISEELIARRKPMLDELVRLVVCGEETAAKAILEMDPSFLLWKAGMATDYSGRHIKNLTPFQVALCAGDTDMVKMMLPYFDLFPNGQAAMRVQFAEIFPDAEGGLEGHLKRQKENVFDFAAIVVAFQNATPAEVTAALNKEGAQFTEADDDRTKPNDELTLTEALNRFREQFTQKSHYEIVFNSQHLLRSFEIYVTQFDDWSLDQRDLFWRQVIGFVQRFLPACDAQAVAQGIYYITEENEQLLRSFDFRLADGRFYPVDFNSPSHLGFDYGLGLHGVDEPAGWALDGEEVDIHFTKFISSKNTQLRELMPDRPAPATRCIIL